MKISIITAVRNGESTIKDCIESVQSQTVPVEHIIIDGASTDGTLAIIDRYRSGIARIVSEPDKGIYDAMNKGIALASGDVVGILNADDFYSGRDVIAKIADAFESFHVDSLFADLVFVRTNDTEKIVRYYSGADFTLSRFASGWMPPHPTFFVKREFYIRYGVFKTDYRIAADFELLVRFLVRYHLRYHYFPEVIIKMRTGGASTRNLKSNLILNSEVRRACRENGVHTNMFRIYLKYLKKSLQLVKRPV